MGYYTGTEFDVESNIGLKDTSYLWTENRTGVEHSFQIVGRDTAADAISSPDIVLFTDQVLRRDVQEPIFLPWHHVVGNNTELGGNRRFIYAPELNALSLATQEVRIRQSLTEKVQLLEADGSESTVPYQVLLYPSTGAIKRTTLGGSLTGWGVSIGLPIKTSPDRPLYIRYPSIDINGDIEENYIELVNPREQWADQFGGVIDPGGSISVGDWAIHIEGNNTYDINTNTLDLATNAIAFWTDEAGWTWESTATTLTIDGPSTNAITLTGKTVREVVQEINALNIAVKATLLADYYNAADLENTSSATRDIGPYGENPMALPEHVGVYIEHDTIIHLRKPAANTRGEDWFPVLHCPPVRNVGTGSMGLYTLTWDGPESDWLDASGLTGLSDHLDAIREIPRLITGRLLGLDHGKIDPQSVRLYVNDSEASHLIEDYDAYGGVLRLSRDVLSADSIEVSYAYERGYDIPLRFLNINTHELHNEDGYRLYFGVYIMPSFFDHKSSTDYNVKPTIGYVIGNTISEIQTAVATLPGPAAGVSAEAKLIGVFQVSSQGDARDVKILDIRSDGGGITEDADLQKIFKDNPEAQFFADIGYWEGEPYAGQGVIIVQGDKSIIGTDKSLPNMAAPADGGFVDQTGRVDINELRDRLKKHVTVGMYNVLDLD